MACRKAGLRLMFETPASTLPAFDLSRGRFATGFPRCARSSPMAPTSTLPVIGLRRCFRGINRCVGVDFRPTGLKGGAPTEARTGRS